MAAGEIEGVSGGGHGWGYLGYDCLLLLRVCFHNGERKENNEKTRMRWFFRVPTKSLDFIRVSSFIIVPVQRSFSVEFEGIVPSTRSNEVANPNIARVLACLY